MEERKISLLKKHKYVVIGSIVIVLIVVYFEMKNSCVSKVNYVAKVASGTPLKNQNIILLAVETLGILSVRNLGQKMKR